MLSKRQWQWAAENHVKVRTWTSIVIGFLCSIYIALIINTMVEKGKSQIPYMPDTTFYSDAGCGPKIVIKEGHKLEQKKNYFIEKEVANIFLLERYHTRGMDFDLLLENPKCLGAKLADEAYNPNPFVIVVYDKKDMRIVYRIEHPVE
jgi:hypothetical protein